MLKRVSLILVLAVIYFISAKLGLKLAFVNASATAVWPPTGIAIASFLIFGFKIWPAFFIGAFLANVTTAGTILTSLGIATGNTLEGVVGAYLVNNFASGRFAFEKPRSIFIFTICAGIIAPIVSATIGVYSLTLGGFAQIENIKAIWLTWWLGDASGALIVAPLILIWSYQYKISWNFKRTIEAIILVCILFSVSWIIFGQDTHYPIDFIIFPILLWVAFRFGVREIVTATTILSAVAIWGTLSGKGPFVRTSQNESLLLLQSFIAVVAITKAMVASVVAQSRQLDELKSEFVSMASHELKTPMAAIKGLVAMILAERYGELTDQLKKPLNNIAISTDRLISLVGDLLDVSRIESGNLKPKLSDTNIGYLVKETVSELSPMASQKGISIEVSEMDLPIVQADPDSVKQVLHNLVGNAIKFSNQGKIKISFKVAGPMLNTYVTDTGMGIAQKDWGKVFEKFQQISTISQKPPGTGLGLYISKQLMKKMKGRLWLANSKVGEGSTFVFSLPLS